MNATPGEKALVVPPFGGKPFSTSGTGKGVQFEAIIGPYDDPGDG